MEIEQLYFIIGFLLGVMLMGCITVFAFILYYEILEKSSKSEEWLYVFVEI